MIEVKKELGKFTLKEVDFGAKFIPEKEMDIYNFIHQVKGMEEAVDQQVSRIEELTDKIQTYQGTMKQKEMQVYDLIDIFIHIIDDLEELMKKEVSKQEVQIVIDKILKNLDAIGIRQINQRGTKFDGELHKTITEDSADGKSIKEVLQEGYMNIQDGQVIRKATVIVE